MKDGTPNQINFVGTHAQKQLLTKTFVVRQYFIIDFVKGLVLPCKLIFRHIVFYNNKINKTFRHNWE